MNRDLSNRRRPGGSPKLEATKRKIQGWNAFVDKLVGGLPPVQALIWAVLYRHAVDGVVTRANDLLVKDVSVSESTVKRAIKGLRKARLLQVVRQGGLHVGPSTYRLMIRDTRASKQGPTEATKPEVETVIAETAERGVGAVAVES